MNVPRRSLTATLLINGDVLVFGNSNLESNATEFYNPNPAGGRVVEAGTEEKVIVIQPPSDEHLSVRKQRLRVAADRR
jgi:hypothetical protein